MSERVLVIAAHPDDEVIGVGGTMAKHMAVGDSVKVVIMAEGITSRDSERDRSARSRDLRDLATAASEANQRLGVDDVQLLSFPDNRMDSVDLLEITKVIEGLIQSYNPSIVYTHHVSDVNIDHRQIHHAVITALRPIRGAHSCHTLLFWETASSTEWMTPGSAVAFVPNWYVDISKHIETKLKALEAYETEMRPWPHARSIKALSHLAHWRGSNVGVDAAEAFVLGRRIVKSWTDET